ncbi:DOPA-like domain-containing protein [Lineolata rhizophorae]|uniref:DOPA-like domain-containing protein n=1 Tax=Lineolata rhizophorae TaxID=578093 RepID=A0A6A6P0T9_9PEZI|nr:DOPA-like domain-containing protein [Lineolata rhizophorae]
MADPSLYAYPSPLEGWQGLPPLPDENAEDGKSYINPPASRSPAYDSFVTPITNGVRGGFDIHVYFLHTDPEDVKFAHELWERIRREFPELRIYQIWDNPVGPHMVGMFEVNLFNPEQFGAFIPWLVINRGPLSALIHPNTGDDERDHTQRATWMGQPIPLNLRPFKKMKEAKKQAEE